jgi:hypothetical protein
MNYFYAVKPQSWGFNIGSIGEQCVVAPLRQMLRGKVFSSGKCITKQLIAM